MLAISIATCELLIGSLFMAAATLPARPLSLTPVSSYTFDRQNDLDLDDQPDDWVRRKGLNFPHYVNAVIDRRIGHQDNTSLRFDANAAAAVYYSPLIPIDDLHTFYFSAHLKCEGMQHDAAMVSVSFLNHRRERVQRFLSAPVMGTHADWVPVRLDSLIPHEDVRFAVIGCHLVIGPSDFRDIGGKVWFDDLSLGRLPRMELESNFYRHFISRDSPVEMNCKVSGLDPGHRYQLDFEFRDLDENILQSERIPLEENKELADRNLTEFLEPLPVKWTLESQVPGFYTSTATLLRDEEPVASQSTTLVIVALVSEPRRQGEFGWSLRTPLGPRERRELPEIALQAGINALKYPIWQTADDLESKTSSSIAEMFGELITAEIEPVAILSEPPPQLRAQFARNWHGVNEVLSLPPTFWEKSLEPVIARFSSSVRHWQLGDERDRSFLGSSSIGQTLQQTRERIQRISLNAAIGIPWEWNTETPHADVQFVSLGMTAPMSRNELTSSLESTRLPGINKWLLLRLSQIPADSPDDQAAELARLMLAAKLAGVEKIFLDDVYHDQHGLLNTDGSPRRMFIPWRTMALQLQEARYLGTFVLPGGSANAVFEKDGTAFAMVWNDKPTRETLYLGPDAGGMDLWGRRTPLRSASGTEELEFTADPVPGLLVNCSAELARWRIAAHFEKGRMPSAYGGFDDALLLTNTFSHAVSGELTLNLPDGWSAEPRTWTFSLKAGETLRLPTHLRLPPDASLGEQQTTWDLELNAERLYRFRIYRPYIVGLDDVQLEVLDRKLPDGRLEIEQIVTNRTRPPEQLDFRCSLFVPDVRRQKLQIRNLEQGTDRKFYYLPDADSFRGQELWLRLEQEGGRRVLNYRWKVGQNR